MYMYVYICTHIKYIKEDWAAHARGHGVNLTKLQLKEIPVGKARIGTYPMDERETRCAYSNCTKQKRYGRQRYTGCRIW